MQKQPIKLLLQLASINQIDTAPPRLRVCIPCASHRARAAAATSNINQYQSTHLRRYRRSPVVDEGGDPKEQEAAAAAAAAAATANLKEAMKSVKKEDVAGAEPHIARRASSALCVQHYNITALQHALLTCVPSGPLL